MVVGALMYVVIIIAQVNNWLVSIDPPRLLLIIGGWNLLVIAATVVAIIDSIRKIRAKATGALATNALVVKLAAIPFFVLNFAALAAMLIGGLLILFVGGLALWVAVVIGTGLTYLAMLSTSVYSWAAIAQLRRERIITTGHAVLYSILSFLFVTDTATGILLFGHTRRRPALAMVIVLLSLGSVLAAVSVVFFLFSFGTDSTDFSWTTIAGGALLLAAIGIGIAGFPALRRENQRRALEKGDSTEGVTLDRQLGR